MGTFSKQGYEYTSVDVASLGNLSERLHKDLTRVTTLLNKTEEGIRELGYDWEGDKYSTFVRFFWERYDRMLKSVAGLDEYAEWLDEALNTYGDMPEYIQEKIGEILKQVGL